MYHFFFVSVVNPIINNVNNGIPIVITPTVITGILIYLPPRCFFMYRHIISFILFIAIVFSFSSVCFADDVHSTTGGTIWDQCARGIFMFGDLLEESGNDYAGIAGIILKTIGTLSSPQYNCISSPDGLHHSSNWQNATHGTDEQGMYLDLYCDYCGTPFHCYDSELASQLEQGYNDYLTDNGLTDFGVDTNGYLIWYPTLDDIYFLQARHYSHVLINKNANPPITLPNSLGNPYSTGDWCYYDSDLTLDRQYLGQTPFACEGLTSIGLNVPLGAQYGVKAGTIVCQGNITLDSGIITQFEGVISDDYFQYCTTGYKVQLTWNLNITHNERFSYYSCQFIIPTIYIRNYQISVPSLPQTIIVNDISYTVQNFDFSNRSFTVIDDNGDDITITYGDTNYTVTNNTNNITETYNYGSDDTEPDTPTGEDNAENWSYLFRWLSSFKTWLGEQLSGLGGDTYVDNTQDVEINYTNSDGEDDSISGKKIIFNIGRKFNFITQIYNVGLQLVKDITNDSLSAQQVSDGIIPTGNLTFGHVSGDDVVDSPNSQQDGDGNAGDETDEPSVTYTVSLGNATAPAVSLAFPEYDFYGFNFGGYYVLDFSWYAPYKSDVDRLVSGFMWAGFLWLLFKRLPGIITGSSMMSDNISHLDDDSKDS